MIIEADRDRIMQAVRNLVDNAVKYSVEDGAIEIAVWKDEQCAYIRVADYGAGIPEADMKRIFVAMSPMANAKVRWRVLVSDSSSRAGSSRPTTAS